MKVVNEAGQPRFRRRLTRIIATLLLAVGGATLLIVGLLNVRSSNQHQKELEGQIRGNIEAEGNVLVSSHAQLFRSLVADYALLDLHNTIARAVRDDPNVRYGVFVAHTGQVWAYSSPNAEPTILEPGMELETFALDAVAKDLELTKETFHTTEMGSRELNLFGDRIIEFAAPVQVLGEYGGTLRYGISTARMEQAVEQARARSRELLFQTTGIIVLVVLLTLALGAFFAGRIARTITRPILELTQAARALSEGKRDVHVDVHTGDEIETLGDAFNTMVEDLDASYEALAEQNRVVLREVEERMRAVQERKSIEGQLIQAQKMEAFGQLAGGVAHDFNNILAVVVGQLDLTLAEFEDAQFEGTAIDLDLLREDLTIVLQAGIQGANLTRQLLTFARKEANNPRFVDLNDMLDGFERMLRRVIVESIHIHIVTDDQLPVVLIDPGRFEQVLMNLAVNARDAMPAGGELTLATLHRHLEAPKASATGVIPPGTYAVLEVRDTGTGIAPESVGRIFEPFFSTKAAGAGTGLGLATAHGIVRDAEGFIEVRSTPGESTCFAIWIPAAEGEVARPKSDQSPRNVNGDGQCVLVCEDEDEVRRMTARILEQKGYRVISTGDPHEALEILLQRGPRAVELLVSDVVMPGMSGPEVVQVAEKHLPALPVLYISGYTDEHLGEHGLDEQHRSLLRKPFRPQELLEAVASLLSQREDRLEAPEASASNA